MNSFAVLVFAILVVVSVAEPQQDGKSNRRGTGRIIKGTMVRDISKFAYQVFIRPYNRPGSWCGGSLISDQWVLTAAHCVDDSDLWLLAFGTIDREDTRNTVVVRNSDFVIHKSYNAYDAHVNDIALIKLPQPIALTSTIQTIAVARDPSLTKWENKDAIVSGWGQTSSGGPYSRYLQYADVKIQSQRDCVNAWSQNYYSLRIYPSQICLQKIDQNKGGCHGDSGGPLVTTENGKNVLIGIVSFGANRCAADSPLPAVFTRVASHLQWICENTERTVC